MQLSYFRKNLQLKETFSIAYGNYNMRKALVVQLSYLDQKGFGECVEINYYGIDLEEFILKLETIRHEIESFSIQQPNDFYTFLLQKNLHPFLISALDCAYWDLFGKLENKFFSEINHFSNNHLVESSITISIAPIDEQIKKINLSSWKHFKVKCNGFNKDQFEKLIALNRNIALDANASFTEEDCIWLQENQITQQLTYIEQPLEVGKCKLLKSEGFVNWMGDEDVQQISCLEELKNHYQSINVKLMKCGGLTPALELIKAAKKLNFKVMLGCMTESTIGISAGCALAGLLDYADLDGANLVSNDYATGSFVENGKIIISEKPGLGIALE